MSDQMKADATKAGAAWVSVGGADVVGGTDWGQIAAMMAAGYTMLLIIEWFWKRVCRPFAESRGWVKRKRRITVMTAPGELDD